MKLLLLIGFFIATVLGGDEEFMTKEKWVEIRQQCFDEVPVPEKNQEKILKFEFPDEEIYHKYVMCINLKVGNWDDNHGYNAEKIIGAVDKYLKVATSSGINGCLDKNEAKKSTEKWAFDNFICMENKVFKPSRKFVESAIKN